MRLFNIVTDFMLIHLTRYTICNVFVESSTSVLYNMYKWIIRMTNRPRIVRPPEIITINVEIVNFHSSLAHMQYKYLYMIIIPSNYN